MTEEQEREFKEYLSNLDKDTLIDLYLQKCFDTDIEKKELQKEIQSTKTKYQPAPALIYPKLAIGTKVKVYRAFQGYCGIGIIKKGFPTGLTPYYEIQLIKGNYGGFKAPTICYANESNVEVVNGN